MYRAVICLVAVLSVARAHVASAQAPAPGVPPAASQPARDTRSGTTTGTAIVRGRVIDAVTGRAIPRVQVRANTPNPTPNTPPLSPYPWVAFTDGEGRYEIKNIPAGTYAIAATKANYVRAAFGAERVEGPGKRMPIADGQVLDKIDIRLTRAGVVTGKIVDEFGDPVTDVMVVPMRYQFGQGGRRLSQTGRGAQTNDIGEYRIYGLSPGQYYISATLRSFSMGDQQSTDRSGYAATYYPGTANVAEAQRVTIAQGQTISAINLTLLPTQTARVAGVVLDAMGRPLAGVSVSAMQRMGFGGVSNFGGMTQADGKFALSGLTPGEYMIRANLQGTQEQAAQSVTDRRQRHHRFAAAGHQALDDSRPRRLRTGRHPPQSVRDPDHGAAHGSDGRRRRQRQRQGRPDASRCRWPQGASSCARRRPARTGGSIACCSTASTSPTPASTFRSTDRSTT